MPAIEEVLRSMDDGASPEATAAAEAWLAARTVPDAAHAVVVRNPARDAPLATVVLAGSADVEAAVEAARDASPAWAALPGSARARHLRALAALLQTRGTLLAELQTLETGRPIRASRTFDLPLAIRTFEHHAGAARLAEAPARSSEPCRWVLPDTKPLADLAERVAPALAAGRTALLMAPAKAPLTALAFAEVCRDAGLPPGVVTVVCVTLEERPTEPGTLFIVLADADLDAVVDGVAEAVWSGGTSGCCLLVQEGVAERLGQKLRRRLDTIRTGDPLDPSTDLGAVSTPERRAGLRQLLDRAEREGTILVRAPAPMPLAGCFVAPVLALGVEAASALFGSPIPGPVAAVSTFRTAGEALALAENSGLTRAAAVWSSSIDAALDLSTAVRADTVWINAVALADPAASPPIVETTHPASAESSTKARDAVARGVAAAGKAGSWGRMAAGERAAALQGMADALLARTAEAAARLTAATGVSPADATREVEAVSERIAVAAARADRDGGRVAASRPRNLVLLLDEPYGIVGLTCRPDLPLLGLAALLMPALAAGNRVLLVPPRIGGLAPAELAALLGLGALPAGTVTLLDREPDALAALAHHPEVAAVWSSDDIRQDADDLSRACRVKVLWVPYGV